MPLAVKLLDSWWGEMLKIITQGQSYTDLKLSEREREQAQNYVIWYTDVLLAILALLYLTFAREETVVQYFFKYIVPTNYNDQKMIVRERKWEVGIRHAHTVAVLRPLGTARAAVWSLCTHGYTKSTWCSELRTWISEWRETFSLHIIARLLTSLALR